MFARAASALAVSPAIIAAHGSITGLAAAPDGSVSAAVVGRPPQVPAKVLRVDPAGNQLPTLALLGPTPHLRFALAAAAPAGGGAAVGWVRRGARGHALLATAGAVQPNVEAQTIPGLDRASEPTSVTVGPTGAVAVLATRSASQPRLAFRPAGSATFAPTVPIGTKRSRRRLALEYGASYQVALGPDGGGAVLAIPSGIPAPAPILRRISPAGKLGSKLRIALPRADQFEGVLAIGPLGTITVGIEGVHFAHHQNNVAYDAFATSLQAGSTAPSRGQALGSIGEPDVFGSQDLELAVGPGDRTMLVARQSRSIDVWEGDPGSSLTRNPVPALSPIRTSPLIGPDGTRSLLWVEQHYNTYPDPTFATSAADGAFAPASPVDLGTPSRAVDSLGVAAALPGGALELSLSRYTTKYNGPGNDYLMRLTP